MSILSTLKKVGVSAATATGHPLIAAALNAIPTGQKPAVPTVPTAPATPAPASSFPSFQSSGATTNSGVGSMPPIAVSTPNVSFSTPVVPSTAPKAVTPAASYVSPAPAPKPVSMPPVVQQSSGIPFKAGLSDAQKSSITALSQKPATQWSPTDLANWKYATNGAPIPSASSTSAPTTSSAPVVPPAPSVSSNGSGTTPSVPEASASNADAPTTPSAAQAAAAAAEAEYRKSLAMSPDEVAAQAELDRLNESARKAYTGIGDQTMPLEFITGQQRSVEQRALNLAEPLTAKLARLQAQRQAALGASKFALDRADQVVADEKAAATKAKEKADAAKNPIEVGGNLVRLNPATGQYEAVYSAPAKPSEGFTLGEGQQRYGADGKLIATGPAASTTEKPPDVKTVNGQSVTWDAASNSYKPITLPQAPDAVKVQKAQDVMNLAQELLNDPSLGDVVGPVSSMFPTFRGGSADFEAKATRLKSLLTLENLGVLKGAISDRDMEVLSSAASALSTKMSEDGYKKELQNIIDKMKAVSQGSSNQQDDPLGIFGTSAQSNPLGLDGLGGVPMSSAKGSPTAMRTDRHNNPTAMTTDVARTAGLKEGVDYVAGDPFPNNPNLRTATLLGDPIATTIRAIDNMGFYTQSGKPRWDYVAMPKSQWDALSYDQKKQVIGQMYQREGGTALKNAFV